MLLDILFNKKIVNIAVNMFPQTSNSTYNGVEMYELKFHEKYYILFKLT